MRFLFPFSTVPKGSRIVIYGAGEVGYDFYRQIITSKYVEPVLWVDRQYEWFRMLNLPVNPPNEISSVQFDLVVVTAERECVFNSIVRDLNEMGVPQEKIIWKDDYSVCGNIVYSYKDRNLEEEARKATETSPYDYIDEDRLDIVIRYIYAKDLHDHVSSDIHREMYLRFISEQWNEKEPTENYISAFFTEYECKRGKEAFDSSFINLVKSVEANGFERKYFVPVDNKGRLINGAHRIAAAMACGVSVWSLKYPFNGLYYVCNKDSLFEMGFADEQIREIESVYKILMDAKEEFKP